AEQRAPMWLAHMLRDGWRNVTALDADGTMIGLAYGYRGQPGQWWHEQVRAGLVARGEPTDALHDYFELTELHVRPDSQGSGIGEELLRSLLDGQQLPRVLLSTPEGPSRAWRLYRRLGFTDVLRHYRFAGDPRPFAILSRTLPLDSELASRATRRGRAVCPRSPTTPDRSATRAARTLPSRFGGNAPARASASSP